MIINESAVNKWILVRQDIGNPKSLKPGDRAFYVLSGSIWNILNAVRFPNQEKADEKAKILTTGKKVYRSSQE